MNVGARASGILLHITSLPTGFGVGDLGPAAYRFADWLKAAEQTFWQVLPLNPTEKAFAHSPYSVPSSYAGNPILISPELLAQDGWVDVADLDQATDPTPARVDYARVERFKADLMGAAFGRFKQRGTFEEFEKYCLGNAHWLDDYALFTALKERYGGASWNRWPEPVRDRDPDTLASLEGELKEHIEKVRFTQYLFSDQWERLKRHLADRGVGIIGDLPIYVNFDSADTWANPDIFLLDGERNPVSVAGVPPDYYSSTGQLWGNPLYRWDVLRDNRYHWWVQRLKHMLDLFDRIRLDHFRGLVAYWEVPFGQSTAIKGRWVKAPAQDFLSVLDENGFLSRIIAEDLGTITPDVRRVMGTFRLPGMKVLYFAFKDPDPMHPYLPHTYDSNCVVYTGTHDNTTMRGWYEEVATPGEKERLADYLGVEVTPENVAWDMIRLAMMSVADLAIFPVQDILNLGDEAVMNRPGTLEGNWVWRLEPGLPGDEHARLLGRMTRTYGRGRRRD